MTDIPQTAEEFATWYLRERESWPGNLRALAGNAHHTLKSLDQANAAKSPAFMEASRKDLQAFAEAYTAWHAGQH